MSLKAFGEGHQGAGGAPVAGTSGTSGSNEPMTDEQVREVARNNTGARFSEKHPIMVQGTLAHPRTFMSLPSDRSHSDWEGLTGYVKPEKRSGAAAPAVKVEKEGKIGDVRPHPETGERQEIVGHHPKTGAAKWETIAESSALKPDHVTNLKGFSVPRSSVSDDEMAQIVERNRAVDAADRSASAIRTAGGAKLTVDQQAAAGARSGLGGRTAKVRTPRPPTAGQQAASEQESGAALTRKPWNKGRDGSASIVDTAHQHLAHLELYLNTNRDAISAGSDEAKGHGLNAAVHLQAARNALSDALQAKGGGRVHAVDANGEKIFHPDGTPKMVNAPQDDILANSHIKAATDAIRIAHAALNEPAVLRATKEIPEPEAGGNGISPVANHGATRGLRGYAGNMGKMPKHFRISGQDFASKDPWLHEQIARISLGIAGGDRDYTHLTDVFKQTFGGGAGRSKKGSAEWNSETSPERAGRGRVGEVGQPGQPTGFGVGTVPKTIEDLKRNEEEAALPSSDRAPAPGKTQAERIAASTAEADKVRAADKAQSDKREADIAEERANDPKHPASKTPEEREAIRARVQAKVDADTREEKASDAEKRAEKIEARRERDRQRRAAKKAGN